MHRKRRSSPRGRRRATALGTLAAALSLMACVPTLASADPVNDLLNQLGLGSGQSTGAGQRLIIEPPPYTPPLHGTNPHGQGTAGSVTLLPSGQLPYSSDPDENGEVVVVGSSRGEQDSGTGAYHGNVTLAQVLGLPIVQVETNPGDPPQSGPLGPLQDGLDDICSASSGMVCVGVLEMNSSTTDTSSNNSFSGASVDLGGREGLGLSFLDSEGNISQDSSCQNAHGSSSVTELSLGQDVSVGLFGSTSDSQACNDGTSSVNQSSHAVSIGDEELPSDCADGTEDSFFLYIVQVICNANDENGSQADSPYGVREALTTLLLPFFEDGGLDQLQAEDLPIAVLKGTTAAAESHAVAPPVKTTPTNPLTPPAGGTQGGTGQGTRGNGGNGSGEGNGSAAEAARAASGQLAFTGSDLLWLALIGNLLILGGVALTSAARRRGRRA
jgi:hypothetical protein